MKKKKKNKIYDSIRKPLAPPTQRHTNKKKVEKSDLSKRKVKFKKKIDEEE